MSNTCPVTDKEGAVCGKPCEYIFSKRLREAGASERTYDKCAAHRRLARLYGKKSPRATRSIHEKEKEECREPE